MPQRLPKKKIFCLRHAHKLKTADKKAWQNSARYKENALDTPLSKYGFENAKRVGLEYVRLHKKGLIDLTKTKHIYSSPMTRCCTTAIEVIKVVKAKLGHDLKLRINSNLWEGSGICKIIQFTGETTTSISPKYIIIDKKKYNTPFDKKLQFPYLLKHYKDYIDLKYNHITNHGFELPEVSAKRIVKCVNGIVKIEPHLVLIVAHANLNYHIYNYFLQIQALEDTRAIFNDDISSTTMTVGYEFNPNEKDRKKKYKVIYKPNNKFNLSPYQLK